MADLFADTQPHSINRKMADDGTQAGLDARATISAQWDFIGPNGGYLAAILWRAMLGVVEVTMNPVSFSCQYLAPAGQGESRITVEVIARGKRAVTCRADLLIDGSPVVTALARFAAGREGLEITDPHCTQPVVPAPERLRPILEVVPDAIVPPLVHNLDLRVVSDEAEWPITRPVRPHYLAWARFREQATHADRLVDAVRVLVLADSFVWPAAERAYGGQPSHGARSFDLSVSFVNVDAMAPWLLCESTVASARAGVVTGSVRLWSQRGELVAVALSNMYCGPRINGPR
jgi:acyl-CoA thioesterase